MHQTEHTCLYTHAHTPVQTCKVTDSCVYNHQSVRHGGPLHHLFLPLPLIFSSHSGLSLKQTYSENSIFLKQCDIIYSRFL